MIEVTSKDVILEMSKRIDNSEDELIRLRERTHKIENTQSTSEATLEKFDSNLLAIYESQERLSARMAESEKELNQRLIEAEKVTNPFKFVFHHKRSIIGVLLLSFLIGLFSERSVKDIVVALLPDKIVKAGKVIADG